ncbi:MAG: Hpt domain-containing protein [Spirochaetia bacterium]|nr:Hpt domain-containing protein [Spirochaetia bacterium]
MNETPALDIERLYMLFGNDPSLLEQLEDIVHTDFPQHIKEIEAACSLKDFTTLELKAHTLKGSLANAGGSKGSSCAEKLQAAAETKDFKQCLFLTEELKQLVHEFLDEFKIFIQREKT